jgi:transcriptional regulator
MYQPPHFREEDRERQHALMRAHPFALLVTSGPGGLMANGAPFQLDAGTGPLGTLRCHLARANPQWRECIEGTDALVVFQGAEHYVTPSWYATKRQTGKVVPTWNYAMVQVRGRALAIEDADWLHRQIRALTDGHERSRAHPWAVDDAPADFLASQVKGIVGIEIEIASIEGKWKVSQNRPAADQAGVLDGLSAEETPDAAAMAALVAERVKPS